MFAIVEIHIIMIWKILLNKLFIFYTFDNSLEKTFYCHIISIIVGSIWKDLKTISLLRSNSKWATLMWQIISFLQRQIMHIMCNKILKLLILSSYEHLQGYLMNCFAITTSYRQTKIRAVHIIQTHDEWVHFVNIAFSEITVNHHIMRFSD